MRQRFPTASAELAGLFDGQAEGRSTISDVKLAMDMLIEQQEDRGYTGKKWSAQELNEFKQLRDRYSQGKQDAVDKVHDWLNNRAELSRIAEESAPPDDARATERTTERPPTDRPTVEAETERRPTRVVQERHVTSPRVAELQTDGTRVLDPRDPISRLQAAERLTDNELRDLMESRRLLEERLRNGERLTQEETRTLRALSYLETNISNREVHKAVIEQLGASRPEGGFRLGESAGRLTGLSILMTAVLGVYIGSLGSESSRPMRRAQFGT